MEAGPRGRRVRFFKRAASPFAGSWAKSEMGAVKTRSAVRDRKAERIMRKVLRRDCVSSPMRPHSRDGGEETGMAFVPDFRPKDHIGEETQFVERTPNLSTKTPPNG